MVDRGSGRQSASDLAVDRREFLSGSSVAMAAGVVASYGTLVATAGRFLYPAAPRAKASLFVAELKALPAGDSYEFEAPTGTNIMIVRQGEKGTAEDFVALSSTCPHLGCEVHWEPHEHRFVCPCHNGTFDVLGKATGGPPAAAGQSLLHYPLKVENGLLFIEVPIERLASREEA